MDYPRGPREAKPTNWRPIRATTAIFTAMALFGSVAISLAFVLHLDGSRVPPVAKALPWIVGAHTAFGVWLVIAVAGGRSNVRRRLAWWIASIVVLIETLGYSMFMGTTMGSGAMVACGVGIIAAIAAAIDVRRLTPKDDLPAD